MSISSISFLDMVNLIVHYNNFYGSVKSVSENQLLSRGYTKEIIEQLNLQKNLDKTVTLESCGLRFYGDCSKCIYDIFDYVMHLHGMYQRGILPFEGSASDQPGQIIDIFKLIDLLILERQNKLEKSNGKR